MQFTRKSKSNMQRSSASCSNINFVNQYKTSVETDVAVEQKQGTISQRFNLKKQLSKVGANSDRFLDVDHKERASDYRASSVPIKCNATNRNSNHFRYSSASNLKYMTIDTESNQK